MATEEELELEIAACSSEELVLQVVLGWDVATVLQQCVPLALDSSDYFVLLHLK
jgi:hypothetical protein